MECKKKEKKHGQNVYVFNVAKSADWYVVTQNWYVVTQNWYVVTQTSYPWRCCYVNYHVAVIV